MMRSSRIVAALGLVVAVHLPWAAAFAQDVKLEVKSTDTVKSVLERMVGKRVSVVLTSGPELSGIVTSVGDKVVLLSELTGREFFDGVVNIEQIGAVIVRTRTR